MAEFFGIGDNINDTGQYGFVKRSQVDGSKIAENLMIEDDSINKMGTSIPTPYARLYLFDSAFKQLNSYFNNQDNEQKKASYKGVIDNEGNIVPTAYHLLVSECLDMLEFIFKYGDDKENFDVKEWDVEAECKVLMQNGNADQKELGAALLDAYKTTVLSPFSKIYLFKWKADNGEEIILGGTSPITLVYTSPNVRRRLKEAGLEFLGGAGNRLFDNSRPTPLYERSQDFREFMYTYWLTDLSTVPTLTNTQIYKYINNCSVQFDRRIVVDRVNPALKKVKPLAIDSIGSIKTSDVYLYCSHNEFEPSGCDYIIKPTVDFWKHENVNGAVLDVETPLALTSNGIDGYNYIDNERKWNKATDHIPPMLEKSLTDRILPGTTFKYPYITVDDFLEPKIFEVSYNVRKEKFYTGSAQNLTYLLPLKKEFFKFFNVDDLDNMVSVSVNKDTLDVTVTIEIPLEGDKKITFSKCYHDGDKDDKGCDKVRCFDEKMFDLAIFPSYRLPQNNAYNIMLGTTKLDDLKLKFYRQADLVTNQYIVDISDDIRTADEKIGFKTRHLHLDGDFDFIELTVPDDGGTCSALVVPKFKMCPSTTQSFDFCVDFGTTNTHVAYVSRLLGTVGAVKVNEIRNFDIMRSENPNQDDSQIMVLHDDRGAGYFVKFPTFLQREFVPYEIGKNEGIHYPMRTTTWEKIQQEGSLNCFSSVNIGFNYDNELIKEGNLQGLYRTNIKWAKNDPLAPARLKEYFKELLWMMKSKSALNGGGGDFKVVATYPLSMSVPEVQAFKNAWKDAALWQNIDTTNIKFALESVAPYYSFLVDLKYGEPYMNLDIGGGTTDILHVRPIPGGKDESAVFSALFAANDIWGDGVNDANNELENGFIKFYMQSDAYKILPDIKKRDLDAVLKKPGLSSSDFISYLFTHDKDTKDPLNFSQAITSSSEMMRIIIAHFASLMYYTAIILDLAELKIPKKITFTGMGSKYIKLITDDEPTLSLIVSRIFAFYGKMVGNDNLMGANIQIQFSSEPKLVTAQGGLIMDSRPLKDHLIPDDCLCHGYSEEEYGTTVMYGEMSSKKKAVLDAFNNFCSLFAENSMVQALAKLGYDITTDFVDKMKNLAESSFNIVLNANSDTHKAKFAIGDPMFFWPLKETLYQMTKECCQEALNNKEKEHQ